jgi:hypothetical protein
MADAEDYGVLSTLVYGGGGTPTSTTTRRQLDGSIVTSGSS